MKKKTETEKQRKENHATRFAYHVAHNLQGDRNDAEESECMAAVHRTYKAYVREFESGGTTSLYISAVALAAAAGRLAIVRSPRTEQETLSLQGTGASDESDSQGKRPVDLIRELLDIYNHSCDGCPDECGVGDDHQALIEDMKKCVDQNTET